MTAAEQQISGNPEAMESAQARTTVTDQAKVQDIISRMDRAHARCLNESATPVRLEIA
jgi:putative MFS transporter